MGITRAEFDRLLPGVPPDSSLAWRVDAVERPPRALGLISMPVLEVTLQVEGPRESLDRFVERFLLAFQRAGG